MHNSLSAINSLLNSLELNTGADALARVVLNAIKDTLLGTELRSAKEVMAFLDKIGSLIWESKPKFATAIHDLQRLQYATSLGKIESTAALLVAIEELQQKRIKRLRTVVENATPLIKQCKQILVFSFSQTVSDVLKDALDTGASFKLLVASRDTAQITRIISAFQGTSVVCEVVDPLVLSYVVNSVDVAVCGALALTTNEALVVATGSAAIVAQLHAAGVKTYAILSTDKFADWKHGVGDTSSEDGTLTLGKQKLIRRTYSHDMVSAALLTGVITEKGELSGAKLSEGFEVCRQVFAQRSAAIRSFNATPSAA